MRAPWWMNEMSFVISRLSSSKPSFCFSCAEACVTNLTKTSKIIHWNEWICKVLKIILCVCVRREALRRCYHNQGHLVYEMMIDVEKTIGVKKSSESKQHSRHFPLKYHEFWAQRIYRQSPNCSCYFANDLPPKTACKQSTFLDGKRGSES